MSIQGKKGKGDIKMKKMLLLTLFIFIGCSSINKSVITSPVKVTTTTTNINAIVKVGDKITGTAESSLLLGFIVLSGPTEFADGVFSSLVANPLNPTGSIKAAAAYNAIYNSGADIIVNPQYVVKVTRSILYTTIEVTVSGYNGKITGFN
jgi:hypothetical protein|tara:strand:+ start:67 stop:516 length:450 start_codon:yes stop_codon:yes gene_type:complete